MLKKVKSAEVQVNSNIANAAVARASSPQNRANVPDNFAIADVKINEIDQGLQNLLLRVPANRKQDANNVLSGVDNHNTDSIAEASEYLKGLLEGFDKAAEKIKKYVGTDKHPDLSRSRESTSADLLGALSQWCYPIYRNNRYDQNTWKNIIHHKAEVLGAANNLVKLSIADCLKQFTSLGQEKYKLSADEKAEMIVVQLFRTIHAVGHARDNTEEQDEWPACLVQSGFIQIWLDAVQKGKCQADVMKNLKTSGLYPPNK